MLNQWYVDLSPVRHVLVCVDGLRLVKVYTYQDKPESGYISFTYDDGNIESIDVPADQVEVVYALFLQRFKELRPIETA